MADATHAIIGLTGLTSTVGGVNVISERFARLELPETFSDSHRETVQQDLAILSDLVAQHPDQFVNLQNAVLTQDFARARQLASDIGLGEEAFQAKSGGIVILVIAIAVAAALLLSSDTPPTPE